MARRTYVKTTVALDADGKKIVYIPLASTTERVRMQQFDFERLMQLGFSRFWFLSSNGRGPAYVRCKGKTDGGQFSLARLLMRPRSNQVVRYRDGNPLNLRRDNLYLDEGWSKAREAVALAYAAADLELAQ